MKKYRVVVSDRAWADIESAYDWIAEAAPISAARWYNQLIETLNSLRSIPERHPLAPEDPLFDETIRQLLYGKRRPRYRVLYTIRDNEVHVLYVRHSARDRWGKDDL